MSAGRLHAGYMTGKLTDLAHFCGILLISLSYLKAKSKSQIFILGQKFASLEVQKITSVTCVTNFQYLCSIITSCWYNKVNLGTDH